MKTTHWEVEKAFMNVVYHGIVLLVWLVIMAGVGTNNTKIGFAASLATAASIADLSMAISPAV